MPGGNLALGAAEQNTFNQEEGAFGSLPQTSQDKLVQLYNANKGMDPTVAHYALQNQDINPAHVQQAINYLNMVGGMKNGYISQANTDQMGFWQSVRNVFDTIRGNAGKLLNAQPLTPMQALGKGEEYLNAFSQGTAELAKGTWDTAARAASTVTELATGGEIGAQGIGDRSKNLRDAYTTFNNMGYDLEPQHLWGALSHMGSYYESMAARKGWDYTLAHASPNIIAAFLGGGELSMASVDDSIESAATTLTQLQAKVDKGAQLTEDEIAKYQFTKSIVEDAKNRLVAMDERAGITNLVNELNAKLAEDGTLTQQESVALKEATERKAVLDKSRLETPEELKLRDENRLNKMRLVRRGFNTAATNATKYTVGIPIAGARALLDAGKSATTFSLYAATAAQAQADPLTRQLWEQTLNGPVDAYGRPTGSFGETLASYFMSKNNAFFHAASGLTDLYTNYIAADPFAFAGSLSATARSEFGFSGVLGRWYGGIGVRTGDDVFRVMNNSIQITNAFDYMAKHSASDINAMFPYMYNRDALIKLGEAKNINEVAQIHADIADGIGLTRNVMPTLSPWKIFKSTFRSEALDRLGLRGFVGELLTEHYDLIGELADTVKKQTGMDIVPRSLTEVAVDDAGLRAEGIELRRILSRSSASPIYRMERFLARQLTARPMFYDETIKAFTSKEFNPGDIRAIPAIQNLMRIANYPEMVVKTVGDALIHTPDPLDFVNLWTNVVSHMTTTEIRRSVPSMMSETLFAPMRDKVNEIIQTAVGLDGGGVESTYGNGVNASRSSALMDPENPEDIKHAGFLENHLGRLNFFDPRILKGIQRAMVDAVADTYKVGASISDTLFMMERETIRQLAIFRKASISDITDIVRRFYDKHLVEIASHEDNARTDTFNNTHAAIAQRMKNLYADPTKNDVEKFLEAHDYIRENATRIINEMEAYTKRRFDEGTYMYPVSKDIRAAQGEYQAYNDYERALGVKLQENFLDEKSLREWLRNYAEVTLPGQKAAQQDLIDIMRRRIDNRIEQNKSFLNRWQRTVDFGNRALSNTFVPLALYSGGWSLRVAASEYMLNSFRLGPMKLFESKLITSIAKHEIAGVPLQVVEKNGVKVTEADLIKSTAAKAMDVVQNVLVNEAPKFVRDMFAGITMGFERGLLAGMDEERMYRMLDDFVGAIMRHGGHLPGAVHEAANYVDPELFTTHAQNITHGVNDKGEPVQADTIRTPKFVTASGENLATALHENFHRVYGSDLARASMQDLQKIMEDEGISQVTEAEFQALHKRLEELTLKRIEEMDPALRARFKQDTMEMADPGLRTGNGPHADWAWRVVENNLALVHGVSKGGYLLHDGFVDQIASGEIHSPAQIAQELSKMGSATPRDIKARGFLSREQWKGVTSSVDFIKKITNLGHEKVFGPVVNSLVREPIFLLEYHLAMESMRDKLASGILSTDEAEVMADYQALINMKKYVHNPLERTQFENNMRVAAPFYFAQNQAWRRAFRVMEQDPGAFERYLKACLAVTNYVSIHTQGGQVPSLSIPGSQWLMARVGSLGSQLVSGFSPSEQALFNNLGFGLSMDTGSINTIVPTGSVAGRGMFGELARPSWGPLVSIPIDYAAKYFSNHPWFNKAAESFLGPIASQSGMFSEIMPSTAVRGLIGVVGDLLNVKNTSAIASIENQVINDAMDNLHRELRLQVENEYDWTGVTPAQKKALITMVVDREFSDVLKSEKWANIVSKSKYAALAMYVTKLAIGFGSPMALSVRAQFSQSAAFQKIANSIDPDTGQPYSFSKAVALWTQQHPDDVVDLVSKRTAANGTNFPETNQYIKMWNDHSGDIIKYPTLFAYYITRNGAYNPQAYSLQVNSKLENESTPSEYRQAIQTAIGNDYYYNVLEPLYYKKYGTWLGANNPNNNISYQGYKELTQAAREFGINDNPTWWANSNFGVAKAAQEAKAVSQLAQFINDPNAANVVGQQGLANLRELYTTYNQVVTRVREDRNMGANSSAYNLENEWYNLCQKISTEPQWAPQAYLITSVLAKLPTK